MEILISAERIHDRLDELAGEIVEAYDGRPVTVIGILTGCVVLTADLIRRINLPLRLGFITTSSYRGTSTTPGKLVIRDEILPDLTGRHVLLLDDILDTGKTLTRVVAHLLDKGAESVKVAVLLRKIGRQEVPFEPDFVGFSIPDRFVVGYGLDFNDEYLTPVHRRVAGSRGGSSHEAGDGAYRQTFPQLARDMTNVLWMTSDLGANAATKQLALLAPRLPRDRVHLEVVVLGPASGPRAESLLKSGVTLHASPIRSVLDLNGIRRLRKLVSSIQPQVIHAWGPRATLASRLLSGRQRTRLVVSAAADTAAGLSGWLISPQLRRANRIVSTSAIEDERYLRMGVSADSLIRIGPGITPPDPPPDPVLFRHSLDLPPQARLIVAGGRLDQNAGFKDALWAFDILRYETKDLYLILFGEGPERGRLEEFARALAFDDYRVRFPGQRSDFAALLALAEVVWVTHQRGGVNTALEAMAAGRPVLCRDTPDLAGIIDEGETGFHFTSKDRPQLAAKTRPLLDDPALAKGIRESARVRVLERFALPPLIERSTRLYEELAGQR